MAIKAAFMVPHPPLIVPEVGRGGEEKIKETTLSYEKAAQKIAGIKPETIVITSPHAVMYSDYFHISPGKGAKGDFGSFRAPGVRFDEEYDQEFTGKLADILWDAGFPGGLQGERDKDLDHGTMVPLYFIRKYYSGGKIVRIGLSGLPLADHYRFGMYIRQAAEDLDRSVVIVASGDLSHKLQDYGPYGFDPAGPEYDEKIMDVAGRAAFGEMLTFDEDFLDKAAECGHRSFVIMAGAFDGDKVKAEVFSHQDITGVGYGICSFYPEGKDESRHFLKALEDKIKEDAENADGYVKLARASVESCIRNGRRLKVPDELPEGLPGELFDKRAGAFVSIHKNGMLRGCIGTIAPIKDTLLDEIIDNAISASTRDPRFDKIREDELSLLEINVDVLGEPEDIESEDQLDVKRYGVIVSCGGRRGLLLPDLEGVDDVKTQVAIAMQKGGISPSEDYKLQRFEVVRHK